MSRWFFLKNETRYSAIKMKQDNSALHLQDPLSKLFSPITLFNWDAFTSIHGFLEVHTR